MKRELSNEQNGLVYEQWQGQFEAFSHLEYLCGIPQALFMITTRKANGAPNACFHSWSCFSGDAGGYFAIISGLGKQSHTYLNILREKQFCVNFLSYSYYDNCLETIRRNSIADNEIVAGGFTEEAGHTVSAPRIGESFLILECELDRVTDLSGKDLSALVIGRVTHVAMDEKYMEGIDRKYSKDGFMFNINAPVDFATGYCDNDAAGHLEVFGSKEE